MARTHVKWDWIFKDIGCSYSMFIFLAINHSFAAEIGGEITTNTRVGIPCIGECTWINFEDTLIWEHSIRAKASPNNHMYADMQFRFHGGEQLSDLTETQNQSQLQSTSLQAIRLSIQNRSGFWINEIGVQRMAWGVSNGVRILDNLNPMDLRNPTRFDQRLSVPAWYSSVKGERAGFEMAFVPFHTPARLPSDQGLIIPNANQLFKAGEETESLDIRDTKGEFTINEQGPNAIQTGLRASWVGNKSDLGLSWFHGKDSLPQVDGIFRITGFQTDSDRVDVGIPLRYPKVDIIGVDFKTQLPLSVLTWAEAGLFLPEKTAVTASKEQLEALTTLGAISETPSPVPQVETQDGTPYFRWIIGAERNFGPVYLNLQWLHGFPTERQKEDITDYGLWLVQYNPIPEIRLETSGATDIDGLWIMTGINTLIDDGLRLGVQGIWIDGSEFSSLGMLHSASQIHFEVSASY